jgi:hypothetical protein
MPPCFLLLLCLVAPAPAEDALTRARAAERTGQAEAEWLACEAVLLEAGPEAGQQACRARMDWLDARRDPDGGLRGLQELLDLHQGRGPAETGARSQRLARLAEDPRVSERVRHEAALLLARRALQENAPADDILRWTDPLWAALATHRDADLRRQVADLHGRALTRAGRLDEAAAVEATLQGLRAAHPVEGPALDRRIHLQGQLRTGSWLALGLCGLLGLPGLLRRPWPRAWPGGLVPLSVVGGGMAALVALRGDPGLGTLLRLLLGLSLLQLLAGPALLASQPGLHRGLLRLMLGLATLAIAALILDHDGLLLGMLP